MKMTTEEAFIKVLQKHGIEHAFGASSVQRLCQFPTTFHKQGSRFGTWPMNAMVVTWRMVIHAQPAKCQ